MASYVTKSRKNKKREGDEEEEEECQEVYHHHHHHVTPTKSRKNKKREGDETEECQEAKRNRLDEKMFHLNDSFLSSRSNLTQYRIMLSSTKKVVLEPQKICTIKTNCEMDLSSHLNLMVKPSENLFGQLSMEEGFIDYTHKGVIKLVSKNITNGQIIINSGEIIGYIIISPFMIM